MTALGSARTARISEPRSARGFVFGLILCLLVVLPTPTLAQGQIHYTTANSITIPFNTDPTEKRIKQVLLYVSEDLGKDWAQVAAVEPTQKNFRFNARKDGWYWFAVQIQDNGGGLHPPTRQQLQGGLKICLDTISPQLTLRSLQLREHPVAVEWNITEDNPDLGSLRMDYRPSGSNTWMPLNPPQLVQGQYGFTPTVGGTLEVRLQIRDRAGNLGEQITTVLAGQANAAPNPNPNPNPGFGPGAGGPLPGAAPSNVIYVNKRKVALNYKVDNVGKSDVAAVEVWYTEDGRSWMKHPGQAPRAGPYTVELAAERRYGFTLVAISGVGLAERRPSAGDPPQIWVQVDETRPMVKLLGVDVGQGIDAGKMTIRWAATDAFWTDRPIKLSYSAEINGPWLPVAEPLPNDGRYVWNMPQEGLPFQMYIRIEAMDRAGNVGLDATLKPVAVDLLIPKATVIGVEPLAPPAPGPGSGPGPGQR